MGQAVAAGWTTILDLRGLGVLETILTEEDFVEFADALGLLDPPR